MPKRCITPEDLWTLPRVGAAVPSPDGRSVVVPVTTHDIEKNTATTRLWLMPADADGAGDGSRDDAARPLTSPERSASAPAWSRDGAQLAFVRTPGQGDRSATHGDKPQLHVMPADGGEARRLTDLAHGVADPTWLPDGRIVFLAGVDLGAVKPEAAAAWRKEREAAKVPVRVTESCFYRHWDTWLTDDVRRHLFVIDPEADDPAASLLNLTPRLEGRFNPQEPAGHYDVSPDGKEIAFCAIASREPHRKKAYGLFTVPIPARGARRAGRLRRLETPGWPQALDPRYAPDGRTILAGLQRSAAFWAEPIRLSLIDRRTGAIRALESFDRQPAEWRFSADGAQILALAQDEGAGALFAVPVSALRRGGRAAVRRVARGGTFSGLRVAGRVVHTSVSSIERPPEACRIDLRSGTATRTTGFCAPALRTLALGRARSTTFAGADGDAVQMWVVEPPRSAPKPRRGGKRALVHLIHGGPHSAFGDQWHWRWCAQVFAAEGRLVAMVNYHGSDGWGHVRTQSIVGAWGDLPYRDIMAATDVLIAKHHVDPKRMAATGGSYGGYMASWIASQTDRFACIVNHAGVCDLQTQFASDVPEGWPRSAGGDLWSDRAGLDRWSPLRHAHGFRSPMLILHGQRDYRVPADQALQIYNVYKLMGLDARLVMYEEENHWILKPQASLHWYGEFSRWLDRWMKR